MLVRRRKVVRERTTPGGGLTAGSRREALREGQRAWAWPHQELWTHPAQQRQPDGFPLLIFSLQSLALVNDPYTGNQTSVFRPQRTALVTTPLGTRLGV